MFSLKSLALSWDKFFHSKESPIGLAIFRICFGLLNILNAASLIPDAKVWYGTALGTTMPIELSQRLYFGFRVNLFNWLAPTDTAMWIILYAYLAVSILITIGYRTKTVSAILFALVISIQNRNFMILNSGDTVLKCLGFILMFAPSGAALSVDSWLRFKKTGERILEIQNTSIRLLQIQFSLVYLATFLFKAYGDMWLDGTATYYTARLISFQRVVLPYLFDYLWSVKFMTWSALFIEFALGTLIWVKELRYPVVLAGIGLHIGIELTMSIGFFEWMMLVGFLLFIEPKYLQEYLLDRPRQFLIQWAPQEKIKKLVLSAAQSLRQ